MSTLREKTCIVRRGGVIRRETLSPCANEMIWIGELSPRAIRLVEPTLGYHWVNTPWGRGVDVHGEGLELPA